MKRFVLVALAACGSDDPVKPVSVASGSAPVEPAITAELVGCSAALPAPIDPRDIAAPPAPMWQPTNYVPRMQLKMPNVAGDLTPAVVRAHLRNRLAAFQFCYERALQTQPALGGIVEVAFAIQSSGAVASVSADGIDPEVSTCIAAKVKDIAFPKPPDGNQVQVTVALEVRTPYYAPRPARTARLVREWTPFAHGPTASEADAKHVVDAVTTAVRARMTALEQCFDGARGAVRAMLAFDVAGRSAGVRAGGIGDSAIEQCVATALGSISVAAFAPLEVACDFTRGGTAPLRVSPDAGYTVIELTDREARSRTSTREIPPRGAHRSVTMLGTASTVLIVAEPDAPSHGLEFALWWAPAGNTLVAVKASGGAPVFLGMGDSRTQRLATTSKRVLQLDTHEGKLRACIPGTELPDTAPLLDARAMDRVLAAAVAACRQTACEPTVVVGTSGDFIAKELVATTSAARRAGLQQLSIGGPACGR